MVAVAVIDLMPPPSYRLVIETWWMFFRPNKDATLAWDRPVDQERFGFEPVCDHGSSTDWRYGTVLDHASCELSVCPPEDEK